MSRLAHSCGPFCRDFFSLACPISRGCAGSRRVRTSCLYFRATNEPNLTFTENLVVNQLFGTVSGLGMGFITFDWSQIAYTGSPLMVPWWAQVHSFAGFVVLYWIMLPIFYYTNVNIHPARPICCSHVLTNTSYHRPGTSRICLSVDEARTTASAARTISQESLTLQVAGSASPITRSTVRCTSLVPTRWSTFSRLRCRLHCSSIRFCTTHAWYTTGSGA